jgi:hypothetical protein
MATANKHLGTPGLTAGYADAELVRQIKKSVTGMAHFAASGPFGAQCKDCAHYGTYRQVRNKAGDTVKTVFHRGCCAMFLRLTGKLGTAVPPQMESCRHFQHRAEGQSK